jgi:Fur family ferric uptake transcriptional regulator
MEEARRKLETVLRADGYSLTRPRLAVLEYLLNREPVTLSTLSKALANSIDRASVYRTVALFQRLGIVQRINMGLKYKIELSDMFAEHHHHFTCLNCGKVIAMNERALENFVDRLAVHYDFAPTAHQIEIQGYCKDCKKAQV